MIKKIFILCFSFVASCSALTREIPEKKSWTIMVFIAGDNDLEVFVGQSIKQMMKIGSNEHVNIVAQVNTYENRYQRKSSKTVYIEKNNPRIISLSTKQSLTDSGSAETLINFCTQTIRLFPAEHYALIFWDHGTGAIDPFVSRDLEASDLFLFDTPPDASAETFPHFFEPTEQTELYKGVCFDDTTGNFLTESKLQAAFKRISREALNGKKIDIVGFDACFMAMIEVASFVKDYAHFMVASQEVELGTGWDYKRILAPFLEGNLTPLELGTHIVKSYAKTYTFIDDFTLSCFDLQHTSLFEQTLFALFAFFEEAFIQSPHATLELLQISRFPHSCTHFNEPDFIDIAHFLKNLLKNTPYTSLPSSLKESALKKLSTCLKALEALVVANKTGSYFCDAGGISIYFPDYKIHQSYKQNKFAHKTKWLPLLQHYLR